MFNKKIILAIIISFALAGYITTEAKEVKKTGTTAAKFLSIGIGPRANAMGGAFTSISNDASALYWNPAGIALLDRYEGIFTYTSLFADINLNYVGVVLPAGDFGSFGFAVTVLDFGEMDVTTEYFPDGTGEKFTAGSYAFGLTYARQITEDFLVGMNIKYIRENIFNSSADGFSFDIGTIFNTPFYGIRFSSSITNYGTKMQMQGDDLLVRYDPDPTRQGNNETIDSYLSTDKFELPLRLQIGLSKDFNFLDNQRFTLAVDAVHPNDNSQWVNIGGEVALLDELVMLRAGYKTLGLEDSQEGLTLGAGLNYGGLGFIKISVDYAYQEYEYLGNTHSFGVRLAF
ncbi:MAG: PorV/PorQ family protein [Ignavibacteriaceae bacterium]|nr:PorV/PorQ family protein [Ignavibacteriaceae bacterium]